MTVVAARVRRPGEGHHPSGDGRVETMRRPTTGVAMDQRRRTGPDDPRPEPTDRPFRQSKQQCRLTDLEAALDHPRKYDTPALIHRSVPPALG